MLDFIMDNMSPLVLMFIVYNLLNILYLQRCHFMMMGVLVNKHMTTKTTKLRSVEAGVTAPLS